jgi:hypothetical protein
VGKTAIAEGLAYAIVHRLSLDGSPLPEFLRGKRVLQLDVGAVPCGTMQFGLPQGGAQCGRGKGRVRRAIRGGLGGDVPAACAPRVAWVSHKARCSVCSRLGI